MDILRGYWTLLQRSQLVKTPATVQKIVEVLQLVGNDLPLVYNLMKLINSSPLECYSPWATLHNYSEEATIRNVMPRM